MNDTRLWFSCRRVRRRLLELHETDPQGAIWELLLPEVAKRLPTELAAVDAS